MAATHGNTTTAAWNSQSLGSVSAIGDIDLTADTVDVSTYNAADGFKAYLRGLMDTGEIAITCNYDASDTNGQIAFATDFFAGTSRTLLITFPTATGTTWSFTAIPTGLGKAIPRDDKISQTIKVKPTGKPTFAVATVTGMSACGFSNDVLMMPTFAIGTFEYVVTITNGQTSTIITPVDATGGEVITITAPNGTTQTVATGVASSAIAIAADVDNVIVITISHATKASKTYTFHCAVLAA